MAVLIGIALILDISFIIAWYLNVLVSLYRIRQTNGSYTLMLSQGICDLTGLIQYLWLSIEIATDLMLPISARWSSFLFYTNWLTEYFHYICIGLCRADALINVMAYSVRWKYRQCIMLSIAMWIISIAIDLLLSLLMTDDQNEYMIHNPQIYGIGPFDDNSKNTSATNNTTLVDTLDVLFITINYSAVCISVIIYLTAIGASIYRRKSIKISPTATTTTTISVNHQKSTTTTTSINARLSIESRLTIVAVLNFLPAAILTPID